MSRQPDPLAESIDILIAIELENATHRGNFYARGLLAKLRADVRDAFTAAGDADRRTRSRSADPKAKRLAKRIASECSCDRWERPRDFHRDARRVAAVDPKEPIVFKDRRWAGTYVDGRGQAVDARSLENAARDLGLLG